MNAVEFLLAGLREAHEALREDIAQVQPDWLTWRPAPNVNHIAFLFWHLVRTEDNAIQRRLQGMSSVWEAEKWYEQWGLDPQAIGTGFTPEQAEKVVVPLANFLPYAEKVWANSEAALKTLTEDDLDREFTVQRPDGTTVTNTFGRFLRMALLTHQWWHIGEIRYIKGLQGWRFRA